MTKKQLAKSLTDFNKGRAFVTATKVREWLGIGNNATADVLKGLQAVNGKFFFVDDVVDRIAERSAVKWQE